MKVKKIAWIADFVVKTYKAGGAQYTNEMVVNAGLDKYDIDVITKDDTIKKDYDLYVLNNIRYMNKEMVTDIVQNKPFIRWEHDYWVCAGQGKYPGIIENSLLNVFMSKRHLQEIEKRCCAKIPKAEYITSPIDTDLFCIDKDIKKDKKLVIWTGHDRPDNKGFKTALQYAKINPKLNFKMFGIFRDEHNITPNVEIMGEVDHEVFAGWLKKAQYLMAVPNWIEPSGRSVMEGLLCGCDLIVNDNIGILGEDVDFNNYDAIVNLAHTENKLWELVEAL